MPAMNIINWIILGLGLFACGRILVGLILSNIHQIINNPKKPESNSSIQHPTLTKKHHTNDQLIMENTQQK